MSPSANTHTDQSPILQVSDLTKVYKGTTTPAVQSLSFTVARGEIFGLLGPNGAGKTTTISILSTLSKPTSGHVRVCGLDIRRQPKLVRRKIGVVPQHIALFYSLSASENLYYFGRLYGLYGKKLSDAVQDGLEVAGVTARANEPLLSFSTGMKRRVNLAAGILHRPRLLFLDEPTVGIDAQSRNRILEYLKVLKDQGTAIIYTTHYMEEAQNICSRLAVIDHGRVITQGNTDELLAQYPEAKDLGALFLQLTGRELRDD